MNNIIKNFDELIESLQTQKQNRTNELVAQGLIPEKAKDWTGAENPYSHDDSQYYYLNSLENQLYRTAWFLDRIQWQVGQLPLAYVTLITHDDLQHYGNKLIQISRTYSLENCKLMSFFIERFPSDILITQSGMYLYIDSWQIDDLEYIHAQLKQYWIEHPLCSTKVDKLRRQVATILDSKLYK